MRARYVIGLLGSLLSVNACLAGSRTQPADSPAMVWLQKAEAAANKIDNTKRDAFPSYPRDYALSRIAATYAEFGLVARAKAIAAKLPKDDRKRILNMIPVFLASGGHFDAAVLEAKALGSARALRWVCGITASTDIPKALSIAEIVPKSHRSSAYAKIVEEQVLAGDLAGARNTATRIETGSDKDTAATWLSAGTLFESKADVRRAAADANISIDDIAGPLAELVKARLRIGQFGKARRILRVLPTPSGRSRGYIALAKYHLGRNDGPRSKLAIARALRETAAIRDDDIAQIGRYMQIAHLQARNGDMKAARKSVALLQGVREKQSELVRDISDVMGGKIALVALLIETGRIDDAIKLATRDDGTIMPGAVGLLVAAHAAQGKSKRVSQLLSSVKSDEDRCAMYLIAARRAAKKSRDNSAGGP